MLKKSLFSLFSQLLIFVSGIGTAIITARILGPAGRGEYFMILLIATTLFAFIKSNIETATVYLVNSKKIESNSLIKTLTILGLAAGISGLLIFFLILKIWGTKYFGNLPLGLLTIGLLSLPFNFTVLYLSGILWAENKVKSINVLQVLQPLFNIIGLVLFVPVLELGVMGAVLAYLFSFVATFLICLVMIYREFGLGTGSFSFSSVKLLYGYGLKLQVGEILDFFINRLDTFAISYFLGSTAVGFYSVSINAELIWLLPAAVGYVILPTVSSLVLDESVRFAQKITRTVLALSVFMAFIGALLAKLVITFVFGAAFLPALVPLLILLPGITLLSISKMLKSYLIGKNHPWIPTISSACSIIVSAAMIFVLTPKYGLPGAALSTSVGYSIYAFAVLYGFTKVSHTRWTDTLFLKKSDIAQYFTIFKSKLSKQPRLAEE